MQNLKIIREQLRAFEENLPYALVTIVDSEGGTRTRGKMIVHETGEIIGSIGGGTVEALAIRDARAFLAAGTSGLKSYDLNTEATKAGHACGGAMQVLIETFGTRSTLVLSGAGHINMALMPLAKRLGFRIILLDNRPEEKIAEAIAMADKFIPVTNFEEGLKALEVAPGAFYVLAGPNHDCDGAALAGALTREGKYVGMIGSPLKKNNIFAKLRDRGYTEEQLASVHCPIGLNVGNERPEEIAIGIIAEILMVKNGKGRPEGV